MAHVTIYTSENCAYCRMAKSFLTARQIDFEEIRVDLDEVKRREMMEKSGRRTVPQIFINGQSIGGYEDLVNLAKSSKLNELLNP